MSSLSLLPRVRLHRPGPDILTALSIFLLVVHLAVEMCGGVVTLEAGGFYQTAGLSRPGVLAGKGWQFLTYAFLHGSWTHFLLNVGLIYTIGGRVLNILGARAFLRIFCLGVLGGGILHVLLFPAYPLGGDTAPPHVPLVGASGGMMALLMAFVHLSPDSRMWPLMVSGRNLGRGLMLSTLALFLITPGLGIPGLHSSGEWLAANIMGAWWPALANCSRRASARTFLVVNPPSFSGCPTDLAVGLFRVAKHIANII